MNLRKEIESYLPYNCEEEKDKEIVSTSYYGEALKSMEVLNKLFSLSKVEVDDIELTFNELIKKETWYVGIHK